MPAQVLKQRAVPLPTLLTVTIRLMPPARSPPACARPPLAFHPLTVAPTAAARPPTAADRPPIATDRPANRPADRPLPKNRIWEK